MNDQNVSAPEADLEVVAEVETEVEAPEVVENTEGQAETPPAEDDGVKPEAEEKQSAAKARRERRKAAKEKAERALADAEAEATREKQRADALEQAINGAEKPKEEDFESFEEYQAALSARESLRQLDIRQRNEAAQAHERSQQKVEAAKQARRAELQANFAPQVAEAREKYPDFDALVMGERTPLSDVMQEIVMDSDVGAEVAYQLCKNPAETQAIAGLSPLEQARKLGAIEANLSRPAPGKTTKAPDPMTPVGGTGGGTAAPEKMSVDEYRAWRAAGNTF